VGHGGGGGVRHGGVWHDFFDENGRGLGQGAVRAQLGYISIVYEGLRFSRRKLYYLQWLWRRP
jgi:hypothetical protein